MAFHQLILHSVAIQLCNPVYRFWSEVYPSSEDAPTSSLVLNPPWPLFTLRPRSTQWCRFTGAFLCFLFVFLTLRTSCPREMGWPLRAARSPGSTLSSGVSQVCGSRRSSLMSGSAKRSASSTTAIRLGQFLLPTSLKCVYMLLHWKSSNLSPRFWFNVHLESYHLVIFHFSLYHVQSLLSLLLTISVL